MAFIPAGNVIETTVLQSMFNQPIYNVLHWLWPGVPTAGDVQDLCEEVANGWGANVITHQTSDLTVSGVRARSLLSEISPLYEYLYGEPLPGDISQGAATSKDALCITKRTALPGRSYRGRVYLSGIPSSKIDNNYIDSLFANNLYNGLLAMQLYVEENTSAQLVVLSRHHNKEPRATAVATRVTSLALRNLRVDNQSRRMPKD